MSESFEPTGNAAMAMALSPHEQIQALRSARGETLEAFGRLIGVGSKGRMSEIERGVVVPTPDQALAIEALSGGAINASGLNEIIAKARGVEWAGIHGAADSANMAEVSRGNAGDNFPARLDQGSPVPLPAGAADPGGDGSASGESAFQESRAKARDEAAGHDEFAVERVSRPAAGRSAAATSERMDVTAGETATICLQPPGTDGRLSVAGPRDAARRQSADTLRAERERPGADVTAGETATDFPDAAE